MGLFRKAPSPHLTALAMIGAQAGDRVLLAGHPEPALVAELARTTGLSGQTMMVVQAGARGPYDTAAANAGVLVEMFDVAADSARVPDTGAEHDVVVLHFDLAALDDNARNLLAADALMRLRPGGRVVVIEGRRQTTWFASPPPTLPADLVVDLLTRAGGRGARALSSVDGVQYFEARKPR